MTAPKPIPQKEPGLTPQLRNVQRPIVAAPRPKYKMVVHVILGVGGHADVSYSFLRRPPVVYLVDDDGRDDGGGVFAESEDGGGVFGGVGEVGGEAGAGVPGELAVGLFEMLEEDGRLGEVPVLPVRRLQHDNFVHFDPCLCQPFD